MNEEPWTIKRLLTWTSGYLERCGSSSPRLDAEVLLAHSCQCARILLYTRFDEVPPAEELDTFRAYVKRRSQGEPVAYLVGEREFYSLPFEVNSDVLIPRPETEFLVLEAIDAITERDPSNEQTTQIIDIGTGSGCIAVTLAKHLPNANITAIDLSPAALDVAIRNASRHEVDGQIEFLQGDLFAPLPADLKFDLIVSNPPYVGRNETDLLAKDVAENEPHLALFAGDRGLDVIARLVPESVGRLRPGGKLLFEMSPMIAEECGQLVTQTDGLRLEGFRSDLDGHKRVVKAVRATG